MRIVFNKNISCEDALTCSQNIHKKIEEIYPQLERGINYHISIKHEPNNHKIWLFIYDKDNQHESEVDGKIIKTDSQIVKKYTGTTPTENVINKLI
jgi:hypothetical protein|tara:strand:+ start:102 stop:389 length:288 start_codon:yes stop_codon:yes gene_type:complete